MPGPAPKHPSKRVRRNRPPEMTQLPSEGRRGDPPSWPLPYPRKNELAIWADLWGMSQAVAWERLGMVRTVARYCRRLYEAEQKNSPVMVNAEVRQLEDRLGLSPLAMKRLQWEIAADEVSEQREDRPVEPEARPRRLMAVDPDVASG